MIYLGNWSDHWYLICKIDSEFEYEYNNESNDNPTPLLDKNRPRPSAPKWGWRIVTGSRTCKVRGLGGWCKMINSRVIPL